MSQLDKSEVNLPVPELKNDDSSSCPRSSLSLGLYADNIGFGIYKSFCGQKYFQFTNGSILEIRSI